MLLARITIVAFTLTFWDGTGAELCGGWCAGRAARAHDSPLVRPATSSSRRKLQNRILCAARKLAKTKKRLSFSLKIVALERAQVSAHRAPQMVSIRYDIIKRFISICSSLSLSLSLSDTRTRPARLQYVRIEQRRFATNIDILKRSSSSLCVTAFVIAREATPPMRPRPCSRADAQVHDASHPSSSKSKCLL